MRQRTLGKPTSRVDGGVLAAEQPWEGTSVGAYLSVVRSWPSAALRTNASTWKMWYQAPGMNKGQGFAESLDGIRWEKPQLPSDLSFGSDLEVGYRICISMSENFVLDI